MLCFGWRSDFAPARHPPGRFRSGLRQSSTRCLSASVNRCPRKPGLRKSCGAFCWGRGTVRSASRGWAGSPKPMPACGPSTQATKPRDTSALHRNVTGVSTGGSPSQNTRAPWAERSSTLTWTSPCLLSTVAVSLTFDRTDRRSSALAFVILPWPTPRSPVRCPRIDCVRASVPTGIAVFHFMHLGRKLFKRGLASRLQTSLPQ